jgi:hypothetical protein
MNPMNKLAIALAASTLLGAFGLTSASAAPVMPAPAVALAGDLAVDQVAYRRHHGMRHHHHRRMHRMPQSRMMGDPNSRNPSQPGYMQRKGTTSGGPRY